MIMIGEQFTARPPEPRVHPLSNAQCRLALRLAPERSEVRRARHAVEKALMAWGLRRVVFEAVLLSSELVTNAVEHAPHGDIELSLCHDDGIVYIEVEDGSASPPVLQRPDNDAEHGRGLELVEYLATAWGWRFSETKSKIIWCTLAVPPAGGLPPPWNAVPAEVAALAGTVRTPVPAGSQRAMAPLPGGHGPAARSWSRPRAPSLGDPPSHPWARASAVDIPLGYPRL
jgi:anti-sigma regulatory factor (Ser/Thr protein kinase)